MMSKGNMQNSNEEMTEGTMRYISSFNLFWTRVKKIRNNNQVKAEEGMHVAP